MSVEGDKNEGKDGQVKILTTALVRQGKEMPIFCVMMKSTLSLRTSSLATNILKEC